MSSDVKAYYTVSNYCPHERTPKIITNEVRGKFVRWLPGSSLRDDEKLLVALDIRNLKEERNSRRIFYGMAYVISLAIVDRFSSFTRVLHPLKLAVVKTK